MNGIRVSLLIFLLTGLRAQTISVRGQVESDRPFSTSGLMVEITKAGGDAAPIEAVVHGDGSFDLHGIARGTYKVRVTSNPATVICEQVVQVDERPMVIRLPDGPESAGGSVDATVSAKRLMHPVPKKALRAFADADRSIERGRTAEAAKSLERAIEIYPDYYEARTNLGIQYFRLGRREEAVEQLEKAAATAPPSVIVLGNLSYMYFVVGRVPEAEKTARAALAVDSSSRLAHFILGSALARSVTPASLENAVEAAHHLRLGADISPAAHLGIARIYQAKNDPGRAKEELKLYLKSGDNAYRTQAQRWLSSFR